ncbi:SGNH/GDSL hydrolase family protein [Shimia sp.]|uniref:SGNH/GDSL hydrolase family protein n=1 Tax=Shimia sp. TaxID=1954381 RepID=UPI003BAAD2C5
MAQKLAMLGDSMIDTGLDKDNLRTFDRWISGPLVSLLGPWFLDYYNHGVGGETISDCLARVGDVIATDADWVLVECGINDLSRPDTTLESMINDYKNLIRALTAEGRKIVCCTVLERKRISEGGAVADAQYAIRPQFNNWLRNLKGAGVVAGIVDFDFYGHRLNYSALNDADDGTHPNTDRCVEIAGVVAAGLREALQAEGLSPASLGANLLSTPQFMGNEGTSNSGHIAGNIATGWRFLDAQTGTEQIACETLLDAQGGTQTLSLSGAPSGSGRALYFRDNQSSIDLTSGQTVYTSFRLKTAGLKGVIGVFSQLLLPLSGGNQYLTAMQSPSTDGALPYRQVAANMDAELFSIPYTAPEDLTGCTFRIGIAFMDNADLSGSVLLSDAAVRATQ